MLVDLQQVVRRERAGQRRLPALGEPELGWVVPRGAGEARPGPRGERQPADRVVVQLQHRLAGRVQQEQVAARPGCDRTALDVHEPERHVLRVEPRERGQPSGEALLRLGSGVEELPRVEVAH